MICQYYKEHPLLNQKELVTWFLKHSGYEVNQGMISKILSNTYAHLDPLDKKKDKVALESKRNISGNWPDLEAALFEWQQRMENNKAIITQDILRNKAGELWKALP